jgi:ubiquinone/menaquinone biosynthesis C-methylase UbiE
MPFGDITFNFLLCRAAFKNFAEPKRALECIVFLSLVGTV